jgi:hypothetical protein
MPLRLFLLAHGVASERQARARAGIAKREELLTELIESGLVR